MKRTCIGDYIQKGLLIVVLALIPILGTGIVVANDETDNIDIRIAPATLTLNDDVWASDEPIRYSARRDTLQDGRYRQFDSGNGWNYCQCYPH